MLEEPSIVVALIGAGTAILLALNQKNIFSTLGLMLKMPTRKIKTKKWWGYSIKIPIEPIKKGEEAIYEISEFMIRKIGCHIKLIEETIPTIFDLDENMLPEIDTRAYKGKGKLIKCDEIEPDEIKLEFSGEHKRESGHITKTFGIMYLVISGKDDEETINGAIAVRGEPLDKPSVMKIVLRSTKKPKLSLEELGIEIIRAMNAQHTT